MKADHEQPVDDHAGHDKPAHDSSSGPAEAPAKTTRKRRSVAKKAPQQTIAPAQLVVAPKEYAPYVPGPRQPTALEGLTIKVPLVICAEPGLGKTHVADWIARCARTEGWQTYRYSFADGTGDQESRRVVRMVRLVGRKAAKDGRTLVVIDGVAPGDECDCARIARALGRLRDSGCQVVLCLRPEMEQLAEYLPACTFLRGDDLVYRYPDHAQRDWELTGGIGMLVQGLRADSVYERPQKVGTRYLFALSELLDHTIRATLPREDCALRLAAILLGSGTMQELDYVAGRCDFEQFAMFGSEVMLFDVDCANRRFTGHGMVDIDVFAFCLNVLQRHAAQFPHLVVRACEVLASRGDVRRSALVCTLCSAEFDFVQVGTDWGAAYVNAGEVDVVAESLRTARSTGQPLTARAQLSELAVYTVSGTTAQFDAARERMGGIVLANSLERRTYQDVCLFSTCRDVWRNPRMLDIQLSVRADDVLGMQCIDHLRIVRLLTAGRFVEGYSAASNEMILPAPQGVVSALMQDDLHIALTLSGGMPDERERRGIEGADRFFDQVKLDRLKVYHRALRAIPQALMGTSSSLSDIEDAAGRADRAGDAYLQAISLFALAVADLRTRAWPRAHVRACKAQGIAQELELPHLASAAGLANALALEMMGERNLLGQWCREGGHPTELDLLGRLMAQQVGELSKTDASALLPAGAPCPRNALWLLVLLVFDLQAFSEGMAEVLPSAWIEQARLVRARQQVLLPAAGAQAVPALVPEGVPSDALEAGAQTQMPLRPASTARVSVSVLGGFCVKVDGAPLPDSAFERRRARDLMVLLAVVPDHRLRRYQAVDILWPDADYFRGPRKLYEATGEARKQLAYRLGGINVVPADRAQGTVGFDVALVETDVDEFEREARAALAEDRDDFWVLDHARRMEQLYGSGPDQHLKSLGERVTDRMDELESLFVDASVAAGEAALRLGKVKLAVRYGSDAHRLRELREDAMILLVEALRACGRGYEVPVLYRKFARRLIEEEGVSPSLALQRAVSQAADDGPEALTA